MYTAEISRDNPSCFLFLIDQSTSMEDEVSAGDGKQAKANGVADTMNRWLQELSIKCAKSDGIRDYYHVGVLGYGRRVGPCVNGTSPGKEMAPISEIAENPARLEERIKKVSDGVGGLLDQTIRFPVWLDPVADGGTPMCRAAGEAKRILTEWLAVHPDCFPPIVIHITDGESTDGNPRERIQELTNLASSDGNVMVFNIHMSDNPNATSVTFPDSVDELPDEYSKMLFETSSPLTPTMRALCSEHGFNPSETARSFVLNADMILLVQAIDIGTRPANLR
ncbi:MAG: vWA domain-containing protein [Phycisphaerales bacterium]